MVEQSSEKKYHTLSEVQRRKILTLFVIGLMVLLPPFTLFYYKFSVTRPSQTSSENTYELRKGATVSEIATDLYSLGAVNSSFLFNFYVLWNKLDTNIQAGVYVIPAGTSIVELAEMLQHGVSDVRVTFIEGWRVEEFGREAAEKLSRIDYKDFVNAAKNQEGYLFPDTYMFNSEIQEEELIKYLKETFDNKTKDLLTDKNLSKVDLTKEEAIIFASIVEREVNAEIDRPVVAGILIKRWREDMLLGADATTQYVIAQDKYCVPASCRNGNVLCAPDVSVDSCQKELTKEQALEIEWWPEHLTAYDLEFDDPYNTRKNLGLPPKPISNPGLNAIEAVLNYKDTNYYYYLNDAEGNTHYAVTLEEHQNNIYKYLNN